MAQPPQPQLGAALEPQLDSQPQLDWQQPQLRWHKLRRQLKIGQPMWQLDPQPQLDSQPQLTSLQQLLQPPPPHNPPNRPQNALALAALPRTTATPRTSVEKAKRRFIGRLLIERTRKGNRHSWRGPAAFGSVGTCVPAAHPCPKPNVACKRDVSYVSHCYRQPRLPAFTDRPKLPTGGQSLGRARRICRV
jgi:hypothetical protein